jgi:hypothetical protein
MACKHKKLIMKIKSGETKGFNFTIKSNSGLLDTDGQPIYNPVDLSQYTIEFQIKKYPYFSVESIIEKTITTAEDNYNGWIYSPTTGQFSIQITQEDMDKLIPEKDYYVILTMVNGDIRTIISGQGDTSGIFRVCQS